MTASPRTASSTHLDSPSNRPHPAFSQGDAPGRPLAVSSRKDAFCRQHPASSHEHTDRSAVGWDVRRPVVSQC